MQENLEKCFCVYSGLDCGLNHHVTNGRVCKERRVRQEMEAEEEEEEEEEAGGRKAGNAPLATRGAGAASISHYY